MDALVATFVAALLGEWGDKTQLLVIALAGRYFSPKSVLAGVAVGALANSVLAAAGGMVIHDMVNLRALSLLVAVALLFAAAAGLMKQKTPEMGVGWKVGAFVTTATCFFLVEFGDKTQFLTLALSARFDSLGLAAAGATAGVLVANIPAVLLGNALADRFPVRAVQLAVAIVFLLTGFIVAVNALMLA